MKTMNRTQRCWTIFKQEWLACYGGVTIKGAFTTVVSVVMFITTLLSPVFLAAFVSFYFGSEILALVVLLSTYGVIVGVGPVIVGTLIRCWD